MPRPCMAFALLLLLFTLTFQNAIARPTSSSPLQSTSIPPLILHSWTTTTYTTIWTPISEAKNSSARPFSEMTTPLPKISSTTLFRLAQPTTEAPNTSFMSSASSASIFTTKQSNSSSYIGGFISLSSTGSQFSGNLAVPTTAISSITTPRTIKSSATAAPKTHILSTVPTAEPNSSTFTTLTIESSSTILPSTPNSTAFVTTSSPTWNSIHPSTTDSTALVGITVPTSSANLSSATSSGAIPTSSAVMSSTVRASVATSTVATASTVTSKSVSSLIVNSNAEYPTATNSDSSLSATASSSATPSTLAITLPSESEIRNVTQRLAVKKIYPHDQENQDLGDCEPKEDDPCVNFNEARQDPAMKEMAENHDDDDDDEDDYHKTLALGLGLGLGLGGGSMTASGVVAFATIKQGRRFLEYMEKIDPLLTKKVQTAIPDITPPTIVDSPPTPPDVFDSAVENNPALDKGKGKLVEPPNPPVLNKGESKPVLQPEVGESSRTQPIRAPPSTPDDSMEGLRPPTFVKSPPTDIPVIISNDEARRVLRGMLDRPPTFDDRPEIAKQESDLERLWFEDVIKRVDNPEDYRTLKQTFGRLRILKHEVDRRIYQLSKSPENRVKDMPNLRKFLEQPDDVWATPEGLMDLETLPKWKIRMKMSPLIKDMTEAVFHIKVEDLRQYQYRILQRDLAYKFKKLAKNYVEAWDAQPHKPPYNDLMNEWNPAHKQKIIEYCWEMETEIHLTALQPREPKPGKMSWVPKPLRGRGFQSNLSGLDELTRPGEGQVSAALEAEEVEWRQEVKWRTQESNNKENKHQKWGKE